MKDFVSVIMPVYNAERWLDTAVESVKRQTHANWELITVDDGSTDNSLEKLNSLAKDDNRIRVFHKNNGGPAKARALGLSNANGDYSFFLDSDDQLDEYLFERCLAAIHKDKADIAMPNLIMRSDEGIIKDNFVVYGIKNDSIIDGQEAFYRSIDWSGVWATMMCDIKISRRYACNEKYLYGDFNCDDLIARMILLNSNKIVYCDSAYYYNINPNSITKKITPKIFGYLETHIRLINEAILLNQSRWIMAKIESVAFREMIELWHYYLDNKSNFNKEEKKDINNKFSDFNKNFPNENINEMLSVRSGITPKLQRLLLLHGWPLCRISLSLARVVGKRNKLYPWFSEEQIKSLK